jgi:hypothetical protein
MTLHRATASEKLKRWLGAGVIGWRAWLQKAWIKAVKANQS